MEIKRNRTLFAACLLCSLILFGCLEENPYLQRERDPRLDGWWLEIEHSNESDSIDSIFCHYDATKGTVEDYRIGDKFGGSTEYWYTEKNTTGNTSYDGILHTFWVGKNRTDWEHYYRISNDTLKISSENCRSHPIQDVKNWKILTKADSLAKEKIPDFANE